MKKNHTFLICILICQFFATKAQIFPNSDFESGLNTACHCPTGYSCNNDAGRVVDGIHPLYSVGNTGCAGGNNYTNSLGAHSGTGYVYFYAGSDRITTPNFNFNGGEQIQLCVWYAGPQGSGASGQNTANSFFSFGLDGSRVGPNVLVPVGTGWTQHCYTITITAGNHNFSIMSGGSAQYAIWFDDFVIIDTANPPCPKPVVNITGTLFYCDNAGATLDAGIDTGWTYLWNTGDTMQTLHVTQAGNYWVEVTDSCGTSTDTVYVSDNRLFLDLGKDTVLCLGQSLVLDATQPGANYHWQDGSTNSVFTVTSSGLYVVTVTNAANCSASDSVEVKLKSHEAEFSYEKILCSNQIQFVNLSSDTTSSLWDFGDGISSDENNPKHEYNANKKYKVVLIAYPHTECADTAEAEIPFENDVFIDTLFMPNVFTPNGDGKNDYFEIIGTNNPCIGINRLTILNRWGTRVFEAEGSQLTWDGTSNGIKLTEGVYFYVFEGEELKKSGSVVLLR